MKKILTALVALVLAACCQNSEAASFQGGRKSVLAKYPAIGTQCEFKAQVTAQLVQDFKSGNTEMYENLDTYYNFGRVSAEEAAIIMLLASNYERYWGTPTAAYREVVQVCRAGKV